MGNAPWFKFTPTDFMNDEAVKMMDYEARGLYITMICHCWIEGSIPADSVKICKLFNISKHRFKKIWEQLSDKFFEKDERLFNNRVCREKKTYEKHLQQKADAGRLGAEKRWQTHSECHSTPNGTPNGKSMQEVEVEREVEVEKEKRVLNSPVKSKSQKDRPEQNGLIKKTLSQKTGFAVARILNAHTSIFDESNGIDTPKMKKALRELVTTPQMPLDADKLLGLIIQAKEAKGIRNRLAYCIKIIKEPQHQVADGCLVDAKKIVQKWKDQAIDPTIKNMIPNLKTEN